MTKKTNRQPADFIVTLNMNGLRGRMLRLPAPSDKKREFLLVYGQRSSLERWFGLAMLINNYGSVTAPDLPGFGGMDSLYKINKKPTIDNMSDYLASFVKMHYKRRRLTIIGIGYGFVVATRMLQRFPDIAQKTECVISIGGFAHYDDLAMAKLKRPLAKLTTGILSDPFMARLFRSIFIRPLILKTAYTHSENYKYKLSKLSANEVKNQLEVETWLWRNNDIRTHMATTKSVLNLNNCNKQLDLPIWHVQNKKDRTLDLARVDQHLQIIFDDYHSLNMLSNKRISIVLTDAEEAAPFLPSRLRRVLSKA